MELDIKRNNRELLRRYAEELMNYELKNPSKDLEMIHYCFNRVIMDSDYLDELLDSYICAGEHEKLGNQENKKGGASKDIHNIQTYSHELALSYFGIRMALERRIIDKLKNSTEEEKNIFDEMMKKEYKLAVQESKKNEDELDYLMDNGNYKQLLEDRMVQMNISRSKADLQLVYDMNYIGREIIINNGKKEALTLLMSKIKEFTPDVEIVENNEVKGSR